VTAGDWVAVLVGIAGVVVAVAAIPASRARPAVISGSALLIVVALGIGFSSYLSRESATLPSGPAATPKSAEPPNAGITAAVEPVEPFIDGSSKLPEPLLGSWQGEMVQPNYRIARYPIRLTFAQPEAGTIIGESGYATLKCEGILQLTRIDSGSIEFTETITKGAADILNNGCAKRVDFTGKLISGNRLHVSASIDGGRSQCCEAVLSKV
jgi:hypothetical protein